MKISIIVLCKSLADREGESLAIKRLWLFQPLSLQLVRVRLLYYSSMQYHCDKYDRPVFKEVSSHRPAISFCVFL